MENKTTKKAVKGTRKTMLRVAKKDKNGIVSLSYGLSGKMHNILALSTDCVSCSRCVHRNQTTGKGLSIKAVIKAVKRGAVIAICVLCYAFKYLKVRPNVRAVYRANGEQLKRELSYFELGTIANEIVQALRKNHTTLFRIEAFGDLTSTTQALNYLRICALVYSLKRNKKIKIALWTKNYDFLLKAWNQLTDTEKVNNRKILSVVLSSVFIGIPLNEHIREKVQNALGMPVKVFTVKAENTGINCGKRSCASCQKCYDAYNGITDIWEFIK